MAVVDSHWAQSNQIFAINFSVGIYRAQLCVTMDSATALQRVKLECSKIKDFSITANSLNCEGAIDITETFGN